MNNDIRKLIDDSWEDIKELIVKKVEAEQKPKTIWDYNINDRTSYHYIDETGYIKTVLFDEGYFEIKRDLGNAFLTKEEAEFELERREIEVIMRKYSRPFTEGEINYFLACNRDSKANSKAIYIDYYWNIDCGIPCFKSKEIAQKVINEIGEDRLRKYWFGVEGGK